jgi:hypothetical protein
MSVVVAEWALPFVISSSYSPSWALIAERVVGMHGPENVEFVCTMYLFFYTEGGYNSVFGYER